MRITVTVDNPTGDFQDKLLTLLAEHADRVEIDTTWTVERATHYYRSLPARARRIVKEAVERGGYVSANVLRDDPESSLRGHSAALKRIMQRGKLLGYWPDGIDQPIKPDGPGFGKVVGYRMPKDLVETFRAAINDVEQRGARQ